MTSRTDRKMWVAMVLAAMLLAVTPTALRAADEDKDNQHLWKPRVKSVAVFKNGMGFFIRQGDVLLRKGWCVSKEIPPAAFGTLAIYAHGKDQLVDIVGAGRGETVDFDGVDAPKTDAARRERLGASLNLKVQLSYRKETKTLTAAGKLVSVGPRFVILQTDSANFAVPLSDVTRLQVLELPVRAHVTGKGGKDAVKATLGMAYLRKGITWVPEYTMTIIDDDTAELRLRGTLINEAEDLIHCDVNFVVGVPHFVHTRYMAPIAVGQMIRTIAASVAPRQIMSQMTNRMAIVSNGNFEPQFNIVSKPAGGGGGNLGAVMGNLPQMGGPGGSDYTVYTKKNLTVRRGEKAIVTLFTKRIKYSHVYRWSPPTAMKHHLVLHNSTDTAWTTGPCLVISNDRPLSEDLLKYVPKGGSGEIPVTTAINVAHEQSESESERKLKAHSPSHRFYLDLVQLEGKLKLKNFEKRPALVVITAKVAGRPRMASDGGAFTVDTKRLRLMDRRGRVSWTLKLPAGETKTLTYSYERYVPSR